MDRPAERMKSRSRTACRSRPRQSRCSKELYREQDNPHLFIGARNAALGDAAMGATLRRLGYSATVHGMRSAFSTWAHERTAHSNHSIEMCLAHAVGSDIEKVYRRTDLFNKRRKLMEQWATYCCSPPAAPARWCRCAVHDDRAQRWGPPDSHQAPAGG